jgi:hypothetical protein
LGLNQLSLVVENWNEATLNCNYADLNKDLLAIGSKQEFLDAASKSVLFNKDQVSTTLCKRDAETLRYIMGVGGEKNQKSGPPAMFANRGIYDRVQSFPRPLLNIESIMKLALGEIDEDEDIFLDAMEEWSSAKSALSATSYASGVADFSSIIADSSSYESNEIDSSLLGSSRASAIRAQKALLCMLQVLEKSITS